MALVVANPSLRQPRCHVAFYAIPCHGMGPMLAMNQLVTLFV
jgi:hypothetical protein